VGATTAIEWTEHTFNPWWGCTKVSAGCTNCYAEALARRYGHNVWGTSQRRTFSDAHWREPLKWNAAALAEGRPHRVFCASMADVFDEDAPPSEQVRLWSLIEATPWLQWQILTKRPQRIAECVPAAWLEVPRHNVWLGTSIEGPSVLGRISDLVRVPAAVRFLSIEPLLERIPKLPLRGVHWVIVGGESGSRSRPMEPEWVRSIRDRCTTAGVSFFFKQWGGRYNKEKGRTLDGRLWNQLPVVEDVAWDTGRAPSSSIASATGRSARTGS
jgi:protein gp37